MNTILFNSNKFYRNKAAGKGGSIFLELSKECNVILEIKSNIF